MDIKVTVLESQLKEFFHSLCSHSYRQTVQTVLKSGGLGWHSYWDIPPEARVNFVAALLYSETYPTPGKLKEILLGEKRKGPLNMILKNGDCKWWIFKKPTVDIIAGAFTMFTKDEVMQAIKKFEIQHLVGYLPTEHLPLLAGDPRWMKYKRVWGLDNYNRLTVLFERRMKGVCDDEVEEETA